MEKKTAWWRVACTRHTHRRPLAVALPSNYCETVADIYYIIYFRFFSIGCRCRHCTASAGFRCLTLARQRKLWSFSGHSHCHRRNLIFYMQNPAICCIFGRKMFRNAVHDAFWNTSFPRSPFETTAATSHILPALPYSETRNHLPFSVFVMMIILSQWKNIKSLRSMGLLQNRYNFSSVIFRSLSLFCLSLFSILSCAAFLCEFSLAITISSYCLNR